MQSWKDAAIAALAVLLMAASGFWFSTVWGQLEDLHRNDSQIKGDQTVLTQKLDRLELSFGYLTKEVERTGKNVDGLKQVFDEILTEQKAARGRK